MSKLLEEQCRFFTMLAALFTHAVELKLPLKLGCGLCQDPHHSKHSLHKESLAVDLPMIMPDGSYGTWDDYLPLGLYWESLGGSWGGRFSAGPDGKGNDPNHFSLSYGGRR